MKKRWGLLLVLAAVIVTLFLPVAKIYIHSQIPADTAALFPETISMWDVITRGSASLPMQAVPQLGLIHWGQWTLIAGLVLLAAAAAVSLCKRKGSLHAGLVLTFLSGSLLLTFALNLQNVGSSLLFALMITPQVWMWAPLVGALVLAIVQIVLLRKEPALKITDVTWRRMSGVIAIVAVVCMLLPCIRVSAPATLTDDPADAAAMNRAQSMFSEMLGNEQNLSAIGAEKGVFGKVLTGDLAVLEPYSADGNNIKGVFQIATSNVSANAFLLAGVVLLLIGSLLAFLPKVDRWFAVCFHTLGLVAVAASTLSMMSIGAGDMFAAASRQMARLGVGVITPVPAVVTVLVLGAVMCGVFGIRTANVPYFINPLPQKIRVRATALVLAVLALVMCILPVADFSFYKPGKSKPVSTVTVSGIDALTFHVSEDILQPKDSKGKTMYEAEAEGDKLTAAAVESKMRAVNTSVSVATWIALALTLAGIAALAANKNRRIPIILFVAAFAVRCVTWLLLTVQMPRTIGEITPSLFLYISLPLLVFAAFFANFAHLDEVPKKYRLFLMMLPFLVSVFLFSYLPLYGWSYAFYNYKFGVPMSEQEFVGFKWFAEMFTNPGHSANIVRVLKNTLGMSFLGLATSWLPMFFAIFLNEINNARFKKFVQIFTTLPNFISWALVFSFAMCMFAMETGIFSKFMLAIGAIKEPVAWLNSSEHIWVKMWGWGLWKGLGWNSIMYLAAISGIDQQLYEAARVDGANRWHLIRHITLPSLLPTFFVLLLLSISNIINAGMEQYLVFQNPMNKATIEVLDLYVYNITIASGGTTLYSFGTAIGILKTFVSVTLLFTANFASKKLRGESIV